MVGPEPQTAPDDSEMVGQFLFELACMCRAQQMNRPNFLITAVRYKYPTVSVQSLLVY